MNDEVDLSRRGFFRLAGRGATKAAVQAADVAVSMRAAHWIRPPFALDELQFLLTCTRCNACIEACPHDTIFPLGVKRGARVVGTPALDLLNKACHMCQDWPCVTACEPGALKLPQTKDQEQDEGPPPRPRLAHIAIDTTTCLPYAGPECGACESVCPIPGAIKMDMARPRINMEICTGCALCREACITEPKSIKVASLHREPEPEALPAPA